MTMMAGGWFGFGWTGFVVLDSYFGLWVLFWVWFERMVGAMAGRGVGSWGGHWSGWWDERELMRQVWGRWDRLLEYRMRRRKLLGLTSCHIGVICCLFCVSVTRM